MNFNDVLDSLNLRDLYKAKRLLEDKIKSRTLEHKIEAKSKDIKNFLTHYPKFVDVNANNNLVADVQADLEMLDIKRPRTGTSSL